MLLCCIAVMMGHHQEGHRQGAGIHILHTCIVYEGLSRILVTHLPTVTAECVHLHKIFGNL